jgi:DNA-binding XRE family transcriptional regulator
MRCILAAVPKAAGSRWDAKHREGDQRSARRLEKRLVCWRLNQASTAMFTLTTEEAESLRQLGERLRARRLRAGEPQLRTASRIGVSLPTYRKLEQGDPTAQIGVWVRALRLYGGLDGVEDLCPGTLFDAEAHRRRAPRGTR